MESWIFLVLIEFGGPVMCSDDSLLPWRHQWAHSLVFEFLVWSFFFLYFFFCCAARFLLYFFLVGLSCRLCGLFRSGNRGHWGTGRPSRKKKRWRWRRKDLTRKRVGNHSNPTSTETKARFFFKSSNQLVFVRNVGNTSGGIGILFVCLLRKQKPFGCCSSRCWGIFNVFFIGK